MTSPIVKWAGGKTKLLPELLAKMPKKYGTYYEPFAGGAALFFNVRPERAVLGDMNADLVAMYTAVKANVEEVIRRLTFYANAHDKDFYYLVRDKWNKGDLVANSFERAAAFIYLNRTCFNGLWRVNKQGAFNVPMGDYKNPKIVDADNLRAAAHALRNVALRTGSYIDTLEDVRAGDFVYLDPPYDETFNSYTSDGVFDQQTLAMAVELLAERGAHIMLSNSDTTLVRELYSTYHLELVQCGRAINSDGAGRGSVSEVIVTIPGTGRA